MLVSTHRLAIWATAALFVTLIAWRGSGFVAHASPPTPPAPTPVAGAATPAPQRAVTATASPTPDIGPPDPTLPPFRPSASDATPLSLTLDDALVIALRNSPDLMASRDQIQLAQYQVRSQYVPYNPTFTLYGQYNRTQVTAPAVPGLQVNNYNFQGIVQQLVYDFGRVRWSGLAARLTEKQTRQTYRTTLEKLLQSVETTYLSALLADVNVDIARQRLGERRESLKMASDLYKAGFVAQYDVLQYQAQLGQAMQQLLTSEGAAEKAREALVVALGLTPGTPVTLKDPPAPEPPPTDDGVGGLRQALVKRPEVAALTWAVRSAQAQVTASARQSSPTLYLTAQYTGQNDPTGSFTFSQFIPGVTLTIPVLDGRYAHWLRKQAEATLAQTEHQLAVMRRGIEQDVVQAFTDMRTYWQLIDMARLTLVQAKDAYNIAMVRYREGFSNSIELLNAQDTYVQATQSLATAVYNYRVSLVNWRRAISGDYPVEIPASVQVDWEQPPPLLTPATLPTAPEPSPTPTPAVQGVDR